MQILLHTLHYFVVVCTCASFGWHHNIIRTLRRKVLGQIRLYKSVADVRFHYFLQKLGNTQRLWSWEEVVKERGDAIQYIVCGCACRVPIINDGHVANSSQLGSIDYLQGVRCGDRGCGTVFCGADRDDDLAGIPDCLGDWFSTLEGGFNGVEAFRIFVGYDLRCWCNC